MRILIIGGTRFIGPYVLRELAGAGHTLAIFHRGQSQIELPEGTQEILGDRKEIGEYQAELFRFGPDVVLDMIPFVESDAAGLVDVMLGLAGRLVVVSSMDVYRAYGRLIGTEPGPPEPMPLTEESPLREKLYPYRSDPPRSPDDPQRWMDEYDKIPIERLVMSQPDLPGTILRLPMVYGPGDGQHRLFPYLKPMDDHRPAILLGRSQAAWRTTRGYVEDVAIAIALAVQEERSAGQVFNVGEPQAMAEADWVRAIAEQAGWQGEIRVIPDEQLPPHLDFGGDPRHSLAVSTEKIRRELGYHERIDRAEALRRTIDWERSHPPEKVSPEEFDYGAEDRILESGE